MVLLYFTNPSKSKESNCSVRLSTLPLFDAVWRTQFTSFPNSQYKEDGLPSAFLIFIFIYLFPLFYIYLPLYIYIYLYICMHCFRLLHSHCFPPDSTMLAIILLPLLFVAGVFLYYSAPNSSKLSMLARLSSTVLPRSLRPAATALAPAQKEKTAINEARLKTVFATFDKNGDGFISKQELHQLLYGLGLSGADQDQAADMMESFDTNHDGQIDAQEFCSIYESLVRDEGEGKWVEDVKDAFAIFDKDGDGLITVEELGLVLSSLGINHGVDARRSMINKVDMDGDGKINLAEFMLMMQSSKPLSASP